MVRGELAYWMQRAGAPEAAPARALRRAVRVADGGHWREAAEAWAELGCPYEQARALATAMPALNSKRWRSFERLGARPAAERLRKQLRAAGCAACREGMRASTQTNPHQLTAREIEVLRLLCEGLKNSEIAERLCRSVRTVDHHLAAVFIKLGVSSRDAKP